MTRREFPRLAALLATAASIPVALLVGALVSWLLPHHQQFSSDTSPPDAGPVSVTPVDDAVEFQTQCRGLLARLPIRLLGPAREVRVRGSSTPINSSPSANPPVAEYAAAWGSPAIVLRCGVGKPVALTPSAQLIGVNGVEWVADPHDAAGSKEKAVVWTTTSLAVNVEITVPQKYRQQAATHILNPLAAPLLAAISPP